MEQERGQGAEKGVGKRKGKSNDKGSGKGKGNLKGKAERGMKTHEKRWEKGKKKVNVDLNIDYSFRRAQFTSIQLKTKNGYDLTGKQSGQTAPGS